MSTKTQALTVCDESAKSASLTDMATELLVRLTITVWKRGNKDRWLMGKYLIELRKRAGHGNWMTFVESNLPFSYRSAAVYIEYAETTPEEQVETKPIYRMKECDPDAPRSKSQTKKSNSLKDLDAAVKKLQAVYENPIDPNDYDDAIHKLDQSDALSQKIRHGLTQIRSAA